MNNKTSNVYPWVVVGLLWGVALLNYMDRQMLSTMRIPMMEDVRELESAANFGRLMAVFLWVYGLMSPLSGIIGDRVNRKWLIVGSLCVWSGVTYLMGYATTFNQLYWLRGIMGISEALYLPAALSLIADFHKDKTRSLAVGIHMTGLYVGQAIGGFGATFAAIYSWHTTFHWFGIIGVGYGIILAFFLRDKERGNVSENQKMKKIPVLKSLGMLFSNVFFWVILFYSFVLTIRRVGRWIYIRPMGIKKCTWKSIYWCVGFGAYHTFPAVYRIWSFYFCIGHGSGVIRNRFWHV